MVCSSDAGIGNDSPAEANNIPGRFAYLKALNRLRPEVLQKLRDDVAPKYADLWTDVPEFQSNTIGLDRMSRLVSLEDEMRTPRSMSILSGWAREFKVRDKWIFDAAVNTIIWNYSYSSVKRRWFWLPPDSPNPPFSPTIRDEWYPSEPWGKFKERIGAQINSQLAQYRSDCKKRNNTSKPELKRDAEWTVRYQRGERAKDIAAELSRRYEQPAQAVYRAIDRFAKEIGLTLSSRRRKHR